MLLKKINNLIEARKSKPDRKKYAPYSVGLYQGLVEKIGKIPRAVLTPFFDEGGGSVDGNIRVYSRHDLDTASCVENLPLLLEVDECNGIVPGIFFLVNDQTYSLASCRGLATSLREKGHVVGLHTVCYLEDDYLGAFQREIDKFTAEIGFRPQTFNAHGLGKQRLETRLKFYEEISERYAEYGFSYSDCCPRMRFYQHVIEDCHWDEKISKRYVKDDFIHPRQYLGGEKCLILTHPCYWVQ